MARTGAVPASRQLAAATADALPGPADRLAEVVFALGNEDGAATLIEKDLHFGAGCIRVVEATAYNIVVARDRLFRPMLDSLGRPMFTERQLEYITLHQVIEKEHDAMTKDFLSFAGEPEERRMVFEGAAKLARLFGQYWERLAESLFSSELPSDGYSSRPSELARNAPGPGSVGLA